MKFIKFFICFIFAAFSLSSKAFTNPLLRIEVGSHTDRVMKISADATGHLVLTASHDKTARLWELPSGQLIKVLRPPIGKEGSSALTACALSANGQFAAVSGKTGINASSIYIFECASGQIKAKFGDFPKMVNDLAFSKDGNYLAAITATKGLHIFDALTGRELGRDEEYGNNSESLDWSNDGCLITGSWDGYLRLYTLKEFLQAPSNTTKDSVPSLTPLFKVKSNNGALVNCVRFSPNEDQIVVGTLFSSEVEVYGKDKLSYLFSTDTSLVSKGGLSIVTWNADGSKIAAGGKFENTENKHLIRYWDQSGKGKPQDIIASTHEIYDLRSLPNGNILFAAEDPAWGILSPNGNVSFINKSPIIDFRNLLNLTVSSDALTVSFSIQKNNKEIARFSIDDRSLKISEGEEHFNANSESSNAKDIIEVRGATDGTIRWYNKVSGKELLVFYLHSDHKNWVLWTPEGYFDCSVGGDKLFGWHVNDDENKTADFFPAKKFWEEFHRPDVINLVVKTSNVDEALKQANSSKTDVKPSNTIK